MEWDLDPQEAQALRAEALQTVRLRIRRQQQKQQQKHQVTGRPAVGEHCLLELQGELLLPELSKSQNQQQNAHHREKHLVDNDDDDENQHTSSSSPVLFRVGILSESDTSAAKSKASLKMGTLCVEGERLKIPGSLVVIDKIQTAKNLTLDHDQDEDEDEDENDNNNSKKQRRDRQQQQQQQQQQQVASVPPLNSWSMKVTSDMLGKKVGEDNQKEDDQEDTSYQVLGPVPQKYFFKAKPIRNMH